MKLSFVVALCAILLPRASGKSKFGDLPEDAFVSPGRYTNAFFGFSLPLPQESNFHIAQVKSPRGEHYLFALGGEEGNTTFVIFATQMHSGDAQKLMQAAPLVSLHGRDFGRGISDQKTPEGRVWKAMYLTVLDGYLLEINIQSLDSNIAKKLEDCVEQVRFFDPAQARAVAEPNGRPYNPTVPQGQQVVIRFVNGTNGKSIRDKGVNIRFGSGKLFWRDTDSKGQIILDIDSAQPRELGVGPDYVFDCRSTRDSNILLARTLKYPLGEIVSKGIVGENLCGTVTASPTPGTLILFVRPRTSREKREL